MPPINASIWAGRRTIGGSASAIVARATRPQPEKRRGIVAVRIPAGTDSRRFQRTAVDRQTELSRQPIPPGGLPGQPRWMGQRLGSGRVPDPGRRAPRNLHQLFAWRQRLRSMDLAELEQLQHERSLAVDEFFAPATNSRSPPRVWASGWMRSSGSTLFWQSRMISIRSWMASWSRPWPITGCRNRTTRNSGRPCRRYLPRPRLRTAAGTMCSCSPQRETIRKSSPPSAVRDPITRRFSR